MSIGPSWARLGPLTSEPPLPLLSPLLAHLTCLALVTADLLARTWRIQWFARALGHRMTYDEAFITNAFGDAACALTPLRIGGEPARLGGLLQARVPASAALVAISIEILAAWPVILGAAVWLIWMYAPDWWALVGPSMGRFVRTAWPWVLFVVVLSLAGWWVASRWTRVGVRTYRRPVRRVLVYWRRMPRWPIIASLPLTLANVVARTALLPVLALTLPEPPPLGPMLVGSFALLYSQLLLPTPSGLGAVDLGFLAGAAGELGPGQARILLAWRFYSVGLGAGLGLWLAGRMYGWDVLRKITGRKAEPT